MVKQLSGIGSTNPLTPRPLDKAISSGSARTNNTKVKPEAAGIEPTTRGFQYQRPTHYTKQVRHHPGAPQAKL